MVAWKEVSVRCLNLAWRPLCLDAVAPRYFEDFQQFEEEPVVQEIVCLSSSIGLEMNEEDEEDLVEEHRKELSFEEPKQLHNEEAEALKQRIAYRKKVTAFQLRILKKCSLARINCPKLCNIITHILLLWKWALILMAHFWKVQKSRIKQSNLDSFFKKVDKHIPTNEPPTGQSPSTSM